MRKLMEPLTTKAVRMRKDRESLKTSIPMEIVRLMKLEVGSVIEWVPEYDRRQVLLKVGLKKSKQ